MLTFFFFWIHFGLFCCCLSFVLLHFNWNSENNRKRQTDCGWIALIRSQAITIETVNKTFIISYFQKYLTLTIWKQRHYRIYYLQFFIPFNTSFSTANVNRFTFLRHILSRTRNLWNYRIAHNYFIFLTDLIILFCNWRLIYWFEHRSHRRSEYGQIGRK